MNGTNWFAKAVNKITTGHALTPRRVSSQTSGIPALIGLSNQHFQRVLEDSNLDAACDWLKTQCAEQDHSDFWAYHQHWQTNKVDLQWRLQQGAFCFQPVRDVEVTDEQGHTSRKEIRCAEDRLLIRAMAQVLKPVFGEALSSNCVHLAGNGGLKATVAQTQDYINQYPNHQVIKSDIKGYYANIDHTVINEQFQHLLPNEPMLHTLLWQFMRRTVEFGGNYRDVECGLPLGASLSPLLGALYLSPLDELAKSTPDTFYKRYMDDWVWVLPKKQDLRKALKQQYGALQTLRVAMHPDKTFIGKVSKGFDFLGFHLTPTGVTVSDTSLSRHEQKVARLYEQGASTKRIRAYRLRWLAWVGLAAGALATAPTQADVGCPAFEAPSDTGTANTTILYELGLTCYPTDAADGFHTSPTTINPVLKFFLAFPPAPLPVSGAVTIVMSDGSGHLPISTVHCINGLVTGVDTTVANINLPLSQSCLLSVGAADDSQGFSGAALSRDASGVYSVTAGTLSGGPYGGSYTPPVTTKAESTNHPTALTGSVSSDSQITTTWTDATGAVTPDSYLVMCSTTDSFADPEDGTAQTDDTSCADGSGVQNIAQGVETVTWAGLDAGTQYSFKIFPFTNTGSEVDYKTDGTPLTTDATITVSVPTATLTPLLGLINADPTASQTLSFTLNNTGSETVTPNITVTGRDSGVMPLGNTSGCTSLAAGSTCEIQVDYSGSDHEVLGELVVNDAASGNLLATALLVSKEATAHEAARRLPDVLSSVTLPIKFKHGVPLTNDIEWSTLSYQSSVYSQIAVFECTQAALDDKTCGSDIADASPAPKTSLVMPAESVSVPTPAWMYKDVAAKQYNFKYSFTPSCPNGESIVLRFYQKSGEDNEANNDTLSLLIPGGSLFENYYYDTVGRRLEVPCEL